MASEIKANKISPATGTAFTFGDSGDTFTVPSGVTLTNSGTASGFGSPAYASNASATDDTVNVDASDNLQFNSGYGSTATAYGCRAWVNTKSDGTIWASGNVSSVTDVGASYPSQYLQVNFTTTFPDNKYAVVWGSGGFLRQYGTGLAVADTDNGAGTYKTTSSFRADIQSTAAVSDTMFAIFR